MIIREATLLDAGELQEVMARCSQGSDIAITVVNTPDFFVRANGYESSAVFVAEDGGEIAGSAACAIRDLVVDGKRRRVGYEFQYFTSPAHRRKGVARTLRQAIEAYLIGRGATMSTLAVMKANGASAGLFESERFRPYGSMKCHFMSTYQHTDLRESATVRPARYEDFPALAKLLSRCWRGHDYFEPITASDLARSTERTPAIDRDGLLVLEESGEIVATAGVWDWGRIMQIEIAAVPRRLHAKSLATEVLRRLKPMPRLFRPGMMLRQWGLSPIGYREPEDLTKLLRVINNMAVEGGVEQVAMAIETDSALEQAVSPLPGIDIPFTLYVKAFDGDWPDAATPVHFDIVDL